MSDIEQKYADLTISYAEQHKESHEKYEKLLEELHEMERKYQSAREHADILFARGNNLRGELNTLTGNMRNQQMEYLQKIVALAVQGVLSDDSEVQ